MIILGIDPGIERVGWAVVADNHGKVTSLDYGCILTLKRDPIEVRLTQIFAKINMLIDKYKPDGMSVEDLYFAANAKTAITVGEARGVILMAAGKKNIPVVSFTPLVVKRTITGYGGADKKQMQLMVKNILKLKQIPQPDDTADALAIALTQIYSYKMQSYLNNV